MALEWGLAGWHSPDGTLQAAVEINDLEAAAHLLHDKHVDPDARDDAGYPVLLTACFGGQIEMARLLLDAGAGIDEGLESGLPGGSDIEGVTPLIAAAMEGHFAMTRALINAGAMIDRPCDRGDTALIYACAWACYLPIVQLLSSYGAHRAPPTSSDHLTAEGVVEDDAEGAPAVLAWLITSREWNTPLHHLEIIEADRARDLLRTGADIYAAVRQGGPTPLSLATEQRAANTAPAGSAADLVLHAAEPWSRQNHDLFPAEARARAVAIFRLGWLLSRQPRFAGNESILDLWEHIVMPLDVEVVRARVPAEAEIMSWAGVE